MIKRGGVEVMNENATNAVRDPEMPRAIAVAKTSTARKNNIRIANENQDVIIKHGGYTSPAGKIVDFSAMQEAAIKGTTYYKDEMPRKDYNAIVPAITVVNETTTVAGARLVSQGKDVVALNFADAHYVGGGYLLGASAQEEFLCRVSGLYNCIRTKPMYYNDNDLDGRSGYTDGMIYSPKVPVFRDHEYNLLEEPFPLSIITSPAPNLNDMLIENATEEKLYAIFLQRIIKILQVAEVHNHKDIILGAFGCGAFGNNPELVAPAFKEALKVVPTFENVCFAVWDNREPPVVFECFKKVFSG